MKLTRRQLRKLILEVYKPGSPADLHDKYGITGGEQAQLDKLTKSDDPNYREQGRELAWDAYEMPIVSDEIFKAIEGMKNVIEAMRLFVDDIPNDMKRRGLSPDKEADTDEYFYTVWLNTIDEDKYKFRKFKNKAINLLRDKPNNAPNLRKLNQAVSAGIREWDDLSQVALENMGY